MPWFPKATSSSPSSSSTPCSSPKSSHQNQQQQQQQQRRRRQLTRTNMLPHLQDRELMDLGILRLPAGDDLIADGDDLSSRLTTVATSSVDNGLPRRFPFSVPQPLPLPDLASLGDKVFRSLDSSGSDHFRLPSRNEAVSKCGENGRERGRQRERGKERERERLHDGGQAGALFDYVNGRRFTHPGARRNADARRSFDRVETWLSSNPPPSVKDVGRLEENYRVQVPFRSCPGSGYASPVLHPLQTSIGDVFLSHQMVHQVWSAPEIPNRDVTSGFPYAFFPEKTILDTSPIHSPQGKSPIRPRTSTSGPASPRHPKLVVETSTIDCESNGHANVHPLPLPPGAISPALSPPIPCTTPKPDFLMMKSQWIKGKLIGRGTFGSVYVATNRETGALCAMKEVELFDNPKSAESMKQLEEIKLLSQLKHPNIVQYYGSEIVEDRFYIYLEYVYPGSINKYVQEHCGAITESVVRNFTRHILSGLAYLHSTKTIHRDIKGANLLVDASGVVKLADFGMAKNLSGQAAHLSLKGSPYWMAPELMQAVIREDRSSDLALAVDIWSLGCTIIEMFTGKPPWSEYEGAAAMFKVLTESPPIPETVSPEGKDFLRCCFQRNPADRPSASMLLEHRFVKNP